MYDIYIYEIFIFILVILKLAYIITTFLYNIAKLLKWNTDTIDFLKDYKNNIFDVVNFGINVLLIILFNPFQSPKNLLDREERFLLFIYGILGVIHYVLQ